ncbi:lipopolysaccharide-induced tumor necrosis factor-alpha factor homolog [Sphaeramia orbicularis]|uniref:lipopolysaccharide-induced tumor necrosis factor-alpha factor homolog n=1 Tax=Sphaeramia orbicularis TaxID=375764 RepID=UPI00117FCF4D|nr:lipopolysaccharide-induced tumor necrosis factor-alpha factor homolog [Sphaeramia orbicularis]
MEAQEPPPSDIVCPLDEVFQSVLEIPPPPYTTPPLDEGVFQTVPERPPLPQVVIQQQQPPAVVPQAFQYTVQTQATQPGVNQMVVIPQSLPRDCPGQMQCPCCHNTVTTQISYKNGWVTWLIVATLFLFLCWPCFIIPFFVDSCKDVVHSCPICNNVIHIHKLGG